MAGQFPIHQNHLDGRSVNVAGYDLETVQKTLIDFKDFVFWIGLVGRKISVYRRRVRRRLVPHFIKRLREIQVHSNGKEHSDQEWT